MIDNTEPRERTRAAAGGLVVYKESMRLRNFSDFRKKLKDVTTNDSKEQDVFFNDFNKPLKGVLNEREFRVKRNVNRNRGIGLECHGEFSDDYLNIEFSISYFIIALFMGLMLVFMFISGNVDMFRRVPFVLSPLVVFFIYLKYEMNIIKGFLFD
jgi:hypothetical protein